MKLFFDTSSLFKLYQNEENSPEIDKLVSSLEITGIYLSEITIIEFSSAIWKKVRIKEISSLEAILVVDLFQSDFKKYIFVPFNGSILKRATNLISKYGEAGLRTLDGIQLSTSIELADKVDLFVCADKLLKSFMKEEGLVTEIPS